MSQEKNIAPFISTPTVTLISLMGQKMPNLLHYIPQYALRPNTKDIPTSQAVSSQQIQEARLHPSMIILYALDSVATIQEAHSTINDKLEALTPQHTSLEQALANLQKQQTLPKDTDATSDEDTDKTISSKDNSQTAIKAELEKLLLDINQICSMLKKHLQQLEQLLPQIDAKLPDFDDKWSLHVKQCCNLIIKDLEQQANIKLDENEQTILQNTLLNSAYLAETRKDLAQKIKMPHNSSIWYIATTAAVATHLSGKLQTTEVQTMIVRLKNTFSQIDDNTKQIIKNHEDAFTTTKDTANDILQQAKNLPDIQLPSYLPKNAQTITPQTEIKPSI